MSQPDVRKGMPPRKLERRAFEQRFKSAFIDPAFDHLQRELQAIADAAWDAYDGGRKAPITRKAGPGFADPDYDIALDWLAARDAIAEAQRRYDDPAGASRILLINGSSRTEHTCPGEMSKSWRLVEIAREVIKARPGFELEILDLSRTTSEFGKTIHPCKSCASTSMALCHWPCSCYPNYSLGQIRDWMNEIFIALEPLGKGVLGTTLRYDYEVRDEKSYFSDIPNPRVSRDMIKLAEHILETKAAHFDATKFKDRYETALRKLVKKKAAGKKIDVPAPEEKPSNVIDLMEALRRSAAGGRKHGARGRGETRKRASPKRHKKAA